MRRHQSVAKPDCIGFHSEVGSLLYVRHSGQIQIPFQPPHSTGICASADQSLSDSAHSASPSVPAVMEADRKMREMIGNR